MNKKLIFVFTVLFLLVSTSAYAAKVAYIVRTPGSAIPKYVNTLTSMGFTVDIIDDNALPTTNFSNYACSIINDETLINLDYMPMNKYPTMLLNTQYLDEFHWSVYPGQIGSDNYIQLYVNDQTHYITQGVPQQTNAYTERSLSINYLPGTYKAIKLKTIVSHPADKTDAVIAIAEPGTRLRDNYYALDKGVFFGISETSYWTTESETLFKNSILWLTTDFLSPTITNLTVTPTNDSATISWKTNKIANSTLYYGTTITPDQKIIDTAKTTEHQLTLSGLRGETTYYYIIETCSEFGYCASSTLMNFRTLDLTKPYLVDLQVTELTNHLFRAAGIASEPVNLSAYLGTEMDNLELWQYGNDYYTDVYLDAGGLLENTKYYYMLQLCDTSDNCVNSSIYSFTTLDLTPPTAPTDLKLEVMRDTNSIKIKWSAVADAINYNIYGSDLISAIDYSNPIAIVQTTEYLDQNAVLDEKKYYVVRAEDSFGNEEKNTNIVMKFDLELEDDYNLVSIPLVPFDNAVGKVINQNSSNYIIEEIKKFDTATNSFKTIIYNPNYGWTITPSLSTISPGIGYFLKSNKEGKFTIVGYPAYSVILDMKTGMNLVGLTIDDVKQPNQLLSQTIADHNISEISKRGTDGKYEISTYYNTTESGQEWQTSFGITPGTGYWVKATKDFELVIT